MNAMVISFSSAAGCHIAVRDVQVARSEMLRRIWHSARCIQHCVYNEQYKIALVMVHLKGSLTDNAKVIFSGSPVE